jgi:hypothetical protein
MRSVRVAVGLLAVVELYPRQRLTPKIVTQRRVPVLWGVGKTWWSSGPL